MLRNIALIDLITRFFQGNLENISTFFFFYLKVMSIVAYLEVLFNKYTLVTSVG